MNNDFSKGGRKQEFVEKNESTTPLQEGFSIDYMAKDYRSFRQLMLDRLNQTTPLWKEENVADIGVTLVELLSYAADQLSYYQDAVATEAYLGTARKRVSIKRHAQLLGYNLHEGHNARAWVYFEVKTPTTVPKGTKLLTAPPANNSACITLNEYEELKKTEFVFETQGTKRTYPTLNKINFHACEKTVTCIPEGSTSAVLKNENNVLFETLCSECDLESQQDRIIEVFRKDFDQEWVDSNSIIELRKNRLVIRNQEGPHQAEFELLSDNNTATLKINDKILRNLYIQKDSNGKKRICFLTLNPGDIIIFEEVKNSETISAEASKRWAVRLTDVKPTICGQTHEPIVEIRWMKEDVTPLPFTVNNSTPNKVCTNTIVRGNVVLADHGDTRIEKVTLYGDQTQIEFWERPITHSVKHSSLGPASKIGQTSFRDSLPNICLFELNRGEQEKREKWLPSRDLLTYDHPQKEFQLELDDDGTGMLLFGKSSRGTGTVTFEAIYRIGTSSAGNIGANTINRVVDNPLGTFSQVTMVSNPLPAIGGVDPEDAETVRHIAPAVFTIARENIEHNQKMCSDGVIRKNTKEPKCSKAVGGERNHRNPTKVYNPPRLDVLAYRVGTYSSFKQNMLDDLRECNNLRRINFSNRDDFALALIDAWACVCDILAFYQERIANEGYLRTATERKSIIELGRSVGIELSTGVAADTFLAFEIKEDLETNERMIIPVGTKLQSIPSQDEKPKIFETSEEIEVSPDWNQIKPHQIVRYPGDLQKEDCIEIDSKTEGLCNGRYIALSGKIDDASQKSRSEVVKIKKIMNNEKLVLILDGKISTNYKIETVKINANVAKATHGESKSEILGGGDPTLSQQEFILKYNPLTYVNAFGKGERTHTLRLFVDGIEWKSVPNFYGKGPNERCYVIRHDENGNTLIRFGDGKRGALPNRGTDNITANYRVGIGTEGMLKAGQLKILLNKQFGVRSVTNPLATINARDPESVSEARQKTSPYLANMGRSGSLTDLENHTPEHDAPRDVGGINKCARDRLYQLLPAIYRQHDEQLNYPLKDLLGVIEKQLNIIEEDIAQLYDNWFIETCEPWVIPYIADLIGVKLPYCNEEDYERNRAFVANCIKCLSCIKDNTDEEMETYEHLDQGM